MYLEFQCAKCDKKLKVREENVGGKVRCPYCHHAQVIQAPSSPPAEPAGPFNFVPEERASAAGGPAARGKPAPRPQAPAHHEAASNGTEVKFWQAALIAVAGFVAIYALLYPARRYYIGGLFWDRGWVQFAETIMFTWSLAILGLKYLMLRKQRDSMLFDLLPTDISKDVAVGTVDKFVAHVHGLPVQPAESFLVNRVLRGLEHFRILKNNGEVSSRLSTQSDIDANAVDSSYTLLKVFVWAIPILGFIGTVQGIGAAVGSFAETMQSASDMSALKSSFDKVTGGLGTAFDTTLLALVLSMFIMFPMSSLLKGEQDLLNWVDEYINENLLKRLKDAQVSEPVGGGVDPKALQAAVDAALTPHHAELRAWSKKLEAIGETLSQQVARGWTKADEQLQARHGQVVKQLAKTTEAVSGLLERQRDQSTRDSETLTQLAERTIVSQSDVGRAVEQSASSLQTYFAALEQGLSSLNRVLGQLGTQQVVIAAPPRRGWRGLFGRSTPPAVVPVATTAAIASPLAVPPPAEELPAWMTHNGDGESAPAASSPVED